MPVSRSSVARVPLECRSNVLSRTFTFRSEERGRAGRSVGRSVDRSNRCPYKSRLDLRYRIFVIPVLELWHLGLSATRSPSRFRHPQHPRHPRHQTLPDLPRDYRPEAMAKTATVLLLAGLCALVAAVPAPVPAPNEDRYTDKYDYIDVAAILENSRIRNQYYNCYLGSEPCITPDAKFFKEKFPEAIVTKCRKCTDKQKESFEKIVVYYTEKEPEKWNAILVKAIKDSQKLSSKKSA